MIATVIVPTRNRVAKITKCLVALRTQTQRDFEIIVVNDGSTDDTKEFLDGFSMGRSDVDFRCLHNETARGANPSRNRAIQESRGELVAFLDDDCIPAPQWLANLLVAFEDSCVAAATGHVENATSRNLFELTLKGTQRVHGDRHATRLVGCNMCVRRSILTKNLLDEDRSQPANDMAVSGRGDEEGLFLALRAAGYQQWVIRDAVVVHDHPHTARSFCRQAWRSGVATARLGYKYHLKPRAELVALWGGYLLLPLLGVHPGIAAALSIISFSLFLAAIFYNEIVRKRKALLELLVTLPLLLLYYHLRAISYALTLLRCIGGLEKIDRVRLASRQRNRVALSKT